MSDMSEEWFDVDDEWFEIDPALIDEVIENFLVEFDAADYF